MLELEDYLDDASPAHEARARGKAGRHPAIRLPERAAPRGGYSGGRRHSKKPLSKKRSKNKGTGET